MSDPTMSFAPVVANLYLAPLGTSISTIISYDTSLPGAFIDLGAINLDGRYPWTPPGTPTRTVVRQVNDSAIWYVSETPSDDTGHWNLTMLESNIAVMEAAYGVEIDEDGTFVNYGGLPVHWVGVLDTASADAVPKKRRVIAPDLSIALSGAVGGDKSNPLETYPLQLSPNPSSVLAGGSFKSMNSWLADLS